MTVPSVSNIEPKLQIEFLFFAAEKPNTQWLRRSFEQLSADMVDGVKGLERCKTYSTNASISLSTGNLLEKSEIPSLNPANRQPTEKLSSHNNQEPR